MKEVESWTRIWRFFKHTKLMTMLSTLMQL